MQDEKQIDGVDCLLIVLPLLGGLFITALSGRDQKSSKYTKPWFQPTPSMFGWVWTFLYFILGLLLFKTRQNGDDTLFYLITGFVFISYFWIYSFSVKNEMRLAYFTVLTLLIISFWIFIEMFYSNIAEDDSPDSNNRFYIYAYVPVIVWMIFILILTSHVKLVDKKKKSNVIEMGGESPFPKSL